MCELEFIIKDYVNILLACQRLAVNQGDISYCIVAVSDLEIDYILFTIPILMLYKASPTPCPHLKTYTLLLNAFLQCKLAYRNELYKPNIQILVCLHIFFKMT